jgi:acyl-CoA thioesterase-1
MIILNSKKIRNTVIQGLFTCGILTGLSNFAVAKSVNCKILVMGDSLSAAYGLPTKQGWVSLMENRLNKKFPHCSVINASISGETTTGGKNRLPDLLKQKPTHMILELGANDGLRGLSIDTMKENLNHMVLAARKNNIKVVLIGMQIPSNYGPGYTQKFKNSFKEIADQQNVPLVPFMLQGFALNPSAFLADGIHPNASAQPKILDNIWTVFSTTLQ